MDGFEVIETMAHRRIDKQSHSTDATFKEKVAKGSDVSRYASFYVEIANQHGLSCEENSRHQREQYRLEQSRVRRYSLLCLQLKVETPLVQVWEQLAALSLEEDN